MKNLVVIHAENGYVDEEFELVCGKEALELNSKLFNDIAAEMRFRIKNSGNVYFVPDDCETPDSENMFPSIRELSSDINFVGDYDIYDQKLLYLKEKLIDSNVKDIDIAGVSYGLCVDEFYRLCYANNSRPNATKDILEFYSKEMGWSKKRFETVYNTIIYAKIVDELTDKSSIPK